MMNQPEHTVSSYDAELAQQERRVLEMGGLVEAQLAAAMDALMKRDAEAAERIVAKDAAVDECDRKVEAGALSILARRQPVASDLRYVFGTIKMAGSLERVGDYAKNISKRTIVLAQHRDVEVPPAMGTLGATVLKMLRDVMDSFTTRDARKAESVWQRDWEIDELTNRILRQVVADMSRDVIRKGSDGANAVEAQTHLLFIGKNLERVGDHATNIAEVIQFQLSGSWASLDRPKADGAMKVAD
ncbi:MAG: phosphate signaling complex protein PhoU [Rhodospirillaceae bacterium]|nr:phosphate signaling complex protein PhoU [Rhodospirillaceae bacterium]